jgi:hypothetical protein
MQLLVKNLCEGKIENFCFILLRSIPNSYMGCRESINSEFGKYNGNVNEDTIMNNRILL